MSVDGSYESFMSLNVKQLQQYLSVRGLNTSGRKIELVAKAFASFEMKLPIVATSEEQSEILKNEYKQMLSKLEINDPTDVPAKDRVNDLTKWPMVSLGNIFSYILKNKEFNTDYIGKYKDQKAYSYFDSGFVGPVLVHELPKRNYVILYSTVTGSQAIHSTKSLWIAVEKVDENGSKILSAWCSCMAGFSETCNHVIACLYKVEYACSKGWCKPSCTETACQWNQGTRKEVEPKRITDIVVRKKLRTREPGKSQDPGTSIPREETRLKNLNEFDPRIESHRTITGEQVSSLIRNIQLVNEKAVLFKSVESLNITNQNNYKEAIIKHIVSGIPDDLNENDKTHYLIDKLNLPNQYIVNIERATRGQADLELWFEVRSGRLTASNHHEVFTKTNKVIKSKGPIKPKITPLVSKIIFNEQSFSTQAMTWGKENEENAFKAFYASEFSKHQNFRAEKCGIFLLKEKSYIAASPDGIVYCQCHGKSIIEIKCPYKIRDKTVLEGAKQSDFLKVNDDGTVKLLESHKYYTQITSQIAISESTGCFFVVWTLKDLFVQRIDLNKKHWENVCISLDIFFKSYICPAVLDIRPVTFCSGCDKVIYESWEVEKEEKKDLDSIQCDICNSKYHLKCENINIDEYNDDWICSLCLASLPM